MDVPGFPWFVEGKSKEWGLMNQNAKFFVALPSNRLLSTENSSLGDLDIIVHIFEKFLVLSPVHSNYYSCTC